MVYFSEFLFGVARLIVFSLLKDLLHDPDEGKVMDCLIDNKENMESEKCQAGITHFQLVSKDLTAMRLITNRHSMLFVSYLCYNFTFVARYI